MTEAEVRGLCLKSREIFLQQPILLELEAPLKICGKKLDVTVEIPQVTQILLTCIVSKDNATTLSF